MSSNISFTPDGLAKLAALIRHHRGNKSYTTFQNEVGISHARLWQIEMAANPHSDVSIKEIKISTLALLAPHVGYTVEQLIAVCRGETEQIQTQLQESVVMAEDVVKLLKKMPPSEIQRLREMLVDEFPLTPEETSQILQKLALKLTKPN